MKINRHGQAALITEFEYVKIRSKLANPKYKLLLDIAKFTGERWGAIVQLRIEDIFDASGNPLGEITFPAGIRKADTKGNRHTRQVPVHPVLQEKLAAMRPTVNKGWMFQSRIYPGTHITLKAADLFLREAVELAGLTHKGFSTHSTRRTFITRLWEAGVDLHTIQLLTGHKDPKALVRYIEADPNRITKALALL
ncbi:tyrosine-type recombinase/integrase [Chlorogloea sp. CCALA 695]|uniref:tyrosine-type recombinase/integrase n=1 Tax=Chlorogloea sp. CCALA 695 TaxID=2107693 RepID=UPI000D07808E|nr:tyrosine-type recombinase/integrase [Chlorogloea sp. CCALA 695]PSB27465.1 integrase [Chlorogloea sp. CCALA 695]